MTTARINQAAAELNGLATEAEGLQKRYSAHLMLYDAACLSGNAEEIAQRREQCHTLLDGILDNTLSVQVKAAELRRLVSGS